MKGMDSNKQITNNIITNNIKGSFFTVLWREREKKIMDFIDPLRISIYHHVIIKEHRKYTFPDILECATSCNQQEFHFNNLDDVYDDVFDFWASDSDIKKSNKTLEEVYNTFVEILENKSMALIHNKIPVYKKICGYKINVMKGHAIPIYGMKIVHTRFKKFDLLFGNDILREKRLTRKYLKQLKSIL
jgi:hypothetical protein